MQKFSVSKNSERIQKTTFKKGICMVIGLTILIFLIGIVITVSIDAARKAKSTEYITYENYSAIQEGMTYEEVVSILDGHEGVYGTKRDWLFTTIEYEYYKWSDRDKTKSITVYVDSKGKVSDKDEFNLTPDPAVEIGEFCFIFLSAELFFILALIVLSKISRKERDKFNDMVNKMIQEIGFTETNKLCFKDVSGLNHGLNKFIAVDGNDQKICWVDYKNENVLVTSFKDIINYEIYENGNVVTQGTGVSAGRLVGKKSIVGVSTFASKSQEMCTELRLIVRLNAVGNPQIVYDLVADRPFRIGLSKNSQAYSKMISSLQTAVSFLEVIIEDNKKPIEVVVVNNNQ